MRFAGERLEFVTQVFGDSSKLSSSGLAITMTNLMLGICSFIQKATSLRVCSSTICTKFNVQIGAGQHLKGFGQASLSGARRVYMPPQLKTKPILNEKLIISVKKMITWVLRVWKRGSQSKQNFLTIESDMETFIKAVAGSFRSANKEPMKTWDQVSRQLLNLTIDEGNEIL